MKICKDCKYLERTSFFSEVLGKWPCCLHPVGVSKVTGKAMTDNEMPAWYARSEEGKCGPDAKWFESKAPILMTDLEMTKLCAAAIGIEVVAPTHPASKTGLLCGTDGSEGRCEGLYDPLQDYAQAWELVKKMKLNVLFDGDEGASVISEATGLICRNLYVKRAIVECVAKIQKARA